MKIHIETRILRRLQDLKLFFNSVLPINVNLSETLKLKPSYGHAIAL